MDDNERLWASQFLKEQYPEFSDEYYVDFFGDWSTYEENGWMAILEKDGKFYQLSYQYSVMVDDNRVSWELDFNPDPISVEYALSEIEEWEESVAQIDPPCY